VDDWLNQAKKVLFEGVVHRQVVLTVPNAMRPLILADEKFLKVYMDAGAKAGLDVPRLSADAEQRVVNYLKDKVPLSDNRNNPVDLVWAPILEAPAMYASCLEIMLPEVDVCLLVAYAYLNDEKFRNILTGLRDRFRKPVVFAAGNPSDQVEGIGLAASEGTPAYLMPDNAVRCIGAMVKRAEFLKKNQSIN